ncbi:uncharacterized protein LOC107045973, partial [Diachasma alloeum]|uniref:uncharacterized protein LOC107045973 n=1 Tax=Diachasma alloeum TaxID=454923 RepID=UPI0007381EB8
METVDLISDDDSFEAPVVQSRATVPITTKWPKLTTSLHFQQIMISSDSSDEETMGNTGATSLEKENIPSVESTSPKIIGLSPEDTASTDFCLQSFAYRPQALQVNAHPQSSSQENSKPAPRRFFRWGSSEDGHVSTSIIKKRPPPSPSKTQTKKRNIEYDDEGDMIMEGPSSMPEACNEMDPNCGCSGEDIGTPSPMVSMHHRLEIAGVQVDFPLTPYPAQKAVMNALIKGCRNEEHALVESPTGSGKTLALLCGALAWQAQYA